ncbi:acetyl-CoA carboxylase carboxyltransferase subunit alpha [candidate division KSB1 bacterium]|nr:acetyl-CoA carboxylase carboxyltransferase subunit alpha [candidate division KSB1 bacterium]
MTEFIFEFEKPIIELERKIQEIKELSFVENGKMTDELVRLEKKARKLRQDIYSKLTRWQRVQLARHPQRPYTLDLIERMMDDFMELHGDRYFSDDPAIVSGIGQLDHFKVAIIGHQKGRSTKEKLYRNFGMPNPEGYRKALRIMHLAEKFHLPIICLIDTPGAYCGIGAEERGQAQAIARNLFEMSKLKVPIVNAVIGEGASGGALGIGIGDRLIMFENTWYSVISPEGCAAILWRDTSKAELAADAMRITANDMLEMKMADEVIAEPVGGAHRDHDGTADILKEALLRHLNELKEVPVDDLVENRIERYRTIGEWKEK